MRAELPTSWRPRLRTLTTLGDRYGVPLLTLLGRVLDPNAGDDGPLGGPAATRITDTLLLWETTTASRAADPTTEAAFLRALGCTLKALRLDRRIDAKDPRLPIRFEYVRWVERGEHATWPKLAKLCDAYGVSPLAVLTYAAAPIDVPPVDSLIACGHTSILDPADPNRQARIEIPGALTILAALNGWAAKPTA